MEDESNHGADSERETLRYGCTKCQTIGKIVDSISEDDDPGHWFELEYGTPFIVGFLTWQR